jgi:Ran GTPase-activating protein (RanGAP) involved in mRNA processing and transport
VPHLTSIQYIQFNNTCTTSDSIKAIAKFCGNTLKSLRVRGCNGITSESCGWMAGAIGHNTPRLRKLQALDAGGTQVDDRGLAYLCKGLTQLQYLDLEHCILTDQGVAKILSRGSFCHMRVLNLRGVDFMFVISSST